MYGNFVWLPKTCSSARLRSVEVHWMAIYLLVISLLLDVLTRQYHVFLKFHDFKDKSLLCVREHAKWNGDRIKTWVESRDSKKNMVDNDRLSSLGLSPIAREAEICLNQMWTTEIHNLGTFTDLPNFIQLLQVRLRRWSVYVIRYCFLVKTSKLWNTAFHQRVL